MSLSGYGEYKHSDVAWLGVVPAHWECTRLKFLLKGMGSGGTPDTDNEDYWAPDGSGTPWVAIGDLSDRACVRETAKTLTPAGIASKGLTVWPAGTLLFSMYASLGHAAELAMPATTNQAILALLPANQINQRFLTRWLEFLKPRLREHASSNTQDNLNAEKVRNLLALVPPFEEQTAISTFLDRETAKIDALIAEQEKLLTLLAEKRQATISHAVTKGLNPDVPMKDSGVAWLGEVPAHWDVGALSRIAERVVVGIAEAATHAYVDEGVPILRSTNVRPGRLIGEVLRIDPSFALERGSKLIRAGDLVTVRTGNAGVTAVVPQELDQCQCFTMLVTTLQSPHSSQYYCYWMNAEPAKRYFSLEGWGTAQVNISVPILKMLPVPIPPSEEQHAIVAFIDEETERLDALTSEAIRAIGLLKERRTALISAAVTGKIDVRKLIPEPEPA